MHGKKQVQLPLDWDEVRVFLALCRSRTVARAARTLGVDASTVSRRLAALEEALGAVLFYRGRDGIAPTEAAEDLMPVAEEIEAAIMRFAGAAERLEREVSGPVRIACPPDFADVVLAPLLGELVTRHPGLRFSVDPGESTRDLTRREADIALRTVRPTRGDLVTTRLFSVPWVLVAAPRLARSLGTLRAWSDAPWVGWGERLAGIAPSRWLAAHARGVEPVVRSDNLVVQLGVVVRGIGIALVPGGSVKHYGLVPVKIGPALRAAAAEWPVDELYLVTHRALRAVPRVHVVWELLLERLGDRARTAGA